MARTIDLNCDMGESFGVYRHGVDEEILPLITSANLACGFHAGDPVVMRRSVLLAKQQDVAVGAHPGFPDLLGFGRRHLRVRPSDLKDYVTYQIGALGAFCRAGGVPLHHVKPHGALYMMALEDEALAEAIVDAILEQDESLLLYTTGGTAADAVAGRKGLRVVREFFGDRPLGRDGWVMFDYNIADAGGGTPEGIARRVLQAVTQGNTGTVFGQSVDMKVDTVCIHSDTPGAVGFMAAIRQALEAAGVAVRPAG
ncbi:MAG: LamB/YcsF family protein [Candidatus Latescibacteria bacterium]|nr:LamB/YcsF family protein [Candidatus Latescibacterota bacterium]